MVTRSFRPTKVGIASAVAVLAIALMVGTAAAQTSSTIRVATSAEINAGASATSTALVTITKSVAGVTGANISDFALYIDGVRVTSGVTYIVAPGTHAVDEVNLSQRSYAFPPVWGTQCPGGVLVVSAGQNKNCTIINTATGVDVPENGTGGGTPGLPNTGAGGFSANSLGILILALGSLLAGTGLVARSLAHKAQR